MVHGAAFQLGKYGFPMLVRVTARMHIGSVAEACTSSRAPHPGAFTLSIDQRSPANPHDLTKFGRMLRRVERMKALYSDDRIAGLNEFPSCQNHDGVLLVSVGHISIQTTLPYCCHVSVVTGEINGLMIELARLHRKTLVFEEWAPIVELELSSSGSPIVGRHSGALPELGALTPSDIDAALKRDTPRQGFKEPHAGTHESRDDALFRSIAQRRSSGSFVATDVGTSVRLCYRTYMGADAALALGSVPRGCGRCGPHRTQCDCRRGGRLAA